jgi:hypothetical protein
MEIAKTASPPLTAQAAFARLGLALLFGALIGVYTSFASPGWIDALISGVALLLPPFLGIWRSRALQQKRLASLALIGALAALLIVLTLISNSVVVVMMVLAPLTASFTVGSIGGHVGRRWWLAVGCGMAAWIGVGIHNLLIPIFTGFFSPLGPLTGFGDLVLIVVSTLYLFGLLTSALSGFVGGLVRAWLERGQAGQAAPEDALPSAHLLTNNGDNDAQDQDGAQE